MKKKPFTGMKNMLPNKNSRHKEGFLVLKNPAKYIGNPSRVIYRSSLEMEFYSECDRDDAVIRWVAEPPWLEVKYLSPKDGKIHRYYPDVYCEKVVSGKLVKFIVEVKPKAFTIRPKTPNFTIITDTSRRNKAKLAYEKQLLRYKIIMAKRQYASELATRMGMSYIFITEQYTKRQTRQK